MIIDKTSIPDLLIIQPTIHNDDRGYFFESYKYSDFKSKGLPILFYNKISQNLQKALLEVFIINSNMAKIS